MAHTELLPDAVLNSVADQIGKLLPRLVSVQRLSSTPIDLGETFSVWMIGANSMTQTDRDLTDLAISTGRWHHQVRLAGQAELFARSVSQGTDYTNQKVREVFQSDIARAIEQGIAWVDQHVADNPQVRLLIVPAYYLHAFWLIENGRSQVLVLDMPGEFTHLQKEKLYCTKEFLEGLAREQPPEES